MARTPLQAIRAILEDRPDIALTDPAIEPEALITGVQLRRHWVATTTNPGGFNPFTNERWQYYGQFFGVVEEQKNREGELRASLRALKTKFESRGGLLILAPKTDAMDVVIEALGPVPEDWPEYVVRQPVLAVRKKPRTPETLARIRG